MTNQLGTRHLLGGRILIGPWTHWTIDQDLMGIEHLRWFDHVLKGVDNGVSSEPPIRYYTIGARPGTEWEFAPQWPLANTRMERLYFAGASTGSIASVNDGSLGGTPPVEATARDTYRVDYGVKVFDGKYDKIARKWDGDMAPGVDKRGLTYTSAPLAGDKRVTGHPVLSLWLSADQPDAQLFAFLEDVSPDGVSRYVSDGVMRASHRAVDPAMEPWKSFGVPYHPSLARDHAPIPEGEAVKLDFDLFATSYIFQAGHRVRLTILGALESFFRTSDSLRADPPPTLRVHRDAVRVSYLDLPVVENPQRVFRGSLSRAGATSDATAYLFASHLYLRGADGGWQQWPLRAAPSGSGWICDTEGKGCSVQLRGDTLEVSLADARFTGRKGSEIPSD